MTTKSTQLLLTRAEVAKLLSLSERTLYELEKSGVLPAVRIGRSVRYRRKIVENFAGVAGAGAGEKEQPVTAAG